MTTLLLERDEELARVAAAVRRARAGHGTLVVVEGPAGMGKTELLRAARDAAEADGMRVLHARGAELERDFAFGVVRQLFEPALAQAGTGERADVLQGPAALAGRALELPGATVDGAHGAPVGPDQWFAVLHGLYWLCANFAAEHPLVLSVDDVHWADPPSLRYLAFLLARLEELPVAIVLGARPEYDGAAAELIGALVSDPAAEAVRLAPLSVAAVGRLVEDGLGAAPDPAFAAACREATGGVPLLVRALVGALCDDAVEPTAAGAAEVERVGARTVGRWVHARLARLPAPAASLARALAILERAELAHAAALAGLAAAEAGGVADLLIAAGIAELSVEPGRPLGFVHPIVRAGVYAEISSGDRAAGHRRAAALLAAAGAGDERVAEHLLATAPAGDAWVVDRLRGAARAAARSGAPETAGVLLRRALEEPPTATERPGLALELGLAETSAGDPEWREHLELALDAAPDDELRVATAMVLGYGLLRDQQSPEAVEVIDRTAERVARGPARLTLEAAAIISGLVDARTAPLLERRLAALRAYADRDPFAPRDVLALAAYAAGLDTVPADTVATLARRALDASARPLPGPADGPWFAQVSVALLFCERYGELDALLEPAIAEARATGDGALFSGAVAHRAWLALRRGDLGAAEGDTRTALEARDLPLPMLYRLLALAAMVDAVRERGDLDEAERIVASAGADVETQSVTAGVLRGARGRLRLAQRRPLEALEDALAAGEVALGTLSSSPSCVPWRSDAALAHLQLGDVEAARRLAQEEVGVARIVGAPRALGIALRTAGVVDGSEALLREAVATFETGDALLMHARAQTDLGALLRRGGRRGEAREILRVALDTAHRLGARPLADRAETELRATGAKPRRAVLSGLAALTASEWRVAELAAQGLTNREIAQALFVTARTVEGHLTQVFRKLDVSSREALGEALGAPV